MAFLTVAWLVIQWGKKKVAKWAFQLVVCLVAKKVITKVAMMAVNWVEQMDKKVVTS